MTEPRRHSLRVPNTGSKGTHEIVYYEWGDEDSDRIAICVHGLTRNARDFDFFARALAGHGYRVFCPSMAGRGESEWLAQPMEYNYATYVADCLALLNNFHFKGVDWIGTSMGGIVGMMIAANVPGRISKLVMNDIGSHLNGPALVRIYGYIGNVPTHFATRAEGEAYLRDVFASFKITDDAVWQHFFDHTLEAHAGGFRLRFDPAIANPIRSQTNNFEDTRDVSLADVWEKVRIPTLIIRGSESDILDETTVKAMRSTNPKAQEYVIPGVGHAPMLDSPSQYQRVLDWLVYGDGNLTFAG